MTEQSKTVLTVGGMTCNGCVAAVTRVLTRVPGVVSAEVDLSTARATVVGSADPKALVAAVVGAGYEAAPAGN